MPVSKKRKNTPKVQAARPVPPASVGRGSFVPGTFRENTDALSAILHGAGGEALPVLFLPMLWTTMAKGVRGNVCLDACSTVARWIGGRRG